MSAAREITLQTGDGRSLALVGTVVGLTTALCVIIFEISGGWWSGSGGRGVAGWVVTAAMMTALLFAEYRVLLAALRRTGLKFNNRRLEPGPPIPLGRGVAVALVASVVLTAGVILFHQVVPILPARSETMLVAVGASFFLLEFADLKANRTYWLEKREQANQGAKPQA